MFEIYSSNAELLAETLITSSMIMNDGDYRYFILSGFLIGIIIMVYMAILGKGGDGNSNARITIVSVTILMALFFPKTDVMVIDRFKGSQAPVSDVPLAVGVVGWFTSTMGAYLNSSYSTTSSGVDGDKGFLSSIYLISLVRDIEIVGKNYSVDNNYAKRMDNNVATYVKNCYIPDFQARDDKVMQGIWSFDFSKNPLIELGDVHSSVPFTPYLVPNANSTTVLSCTDFYARLSTDLKSNDFKIGLRTALLDKYSQTSNSSLALPKGASASSPEFKEWADRKVQSLFQGGVATYSWTLEGGTASSAAGSSAASITNIDDLLLTSYLSIKVRQENAAYELKKVGTQQLHYALYDSLQQRYLQFAAEGYQFQKMSVPVMMFVEMMVFFLTPFIGFMIAIGIGLKVVGMYIKMLVWIQLWPVSLAITNFYINNMFSQTVAEIFSRSGGEVTISTLDTLYLKTHEVIGIGSMWISMVPILTLFILSGSMYVFTQMAQRMQGADTFNEKRVHSDAVDASAKISSQSQMGGATQMLDGSLNTSPVASNLNAGLKLSTSSDISGQISGAKTREQAATKLYSSSLDAERMRQISQNSAIAESLGVKVTSASAEQYANQQLVQTGESILNQDQFSHLKSEQMMSALKTALGAGADGKVGGATLAAKLNAGASLDDVANSMVQEGITKSDALGFLKQLQSSDNFQKSVQDAVSIDDAISRASDITKGATDSQKNSLSEQESKMISARESVSELKQISSSIGTSLDGDAYRVVNTLTSQDDKGHLKSLVQAYSDTPEFQRALGLVHGSAPGLKNDPEKANIAALLLSQSNNEDVMRQVGGILSGKSPLVGHDADNLNVGTPNVSPTLEERVKHGTKTLEDENLDGKYKTAETKFANTHKATKDKIDADSANLSEGFQQKWTGIRNDLDIAAHDLEGKVLPPAMASSGFAQLAESVLGPDNEVMKEYHNAVSNFSANRSAENKAAMYEATIALTGEVASAGADNFAQAMNKDAYENFTENKEKFGNALEKANFGDAAWYGGEMIAAMLSDGLYAATMSPGEQAVSHISDSNGDLGAFNKSSFNSDAYAMLHESKTGNAYNPNSPRITEIAQQADALSDFISNSYSNKGLESYSPEDRKQLTGWLDTLKENDSFLFSNYFNGTQVDNANFDFKRIDSGDKQDFEHSREHINSYVTAHTVYRSKIGQ